MDNINEHLKDPLEELPNELFAHSLSFLPPQSIATTTALSKRWRSTIHSNSTLHREVDLSKWKEVKPKVIFRTFVRLSSLALDHLVKVSFNLQPFFDDWLLHYETDKFAGRWLFDVLSLSRTLKEISLKFIQEDDRDDPIPFVLLIISRLKEFPKLVQVTIDAPVHLQLGIGTEGSSRRFSLTNSESWFNSPTRSQIVRILKEVKALMGDGFTKFSLFTSIHGDEGEDDSEVLEQLESSSITMQHLNVTRLKILDPLKLFNFVVRCSGLNFLRLDLEGRFDPDAENQMRLKVPESISNCSNLKHLDLTLNEIEMDWISFNRWVGNELEELKLDLDVNSSPAVGIFTEGPSGGSIIFNSKETLKHLSLRGVHHRMGLGKKQGDHEFPLLEVLILWIGEYALEFLSDLRSPKLKELFVGDNTNYSKAVTHLGILLRNHASTLVELGFHIKEDDPESVDDSVLEQLILNFESLAHLTILFDKEIDQIARWLSKSQFPSLISASASKDEDEYDSDLSKQLRNLFKTNAPQLEVDH